MPGPAYGLPNPIEPAVATSATAFGWPGPGYPWTPFQKGIIAHAPAMYFPCHDLSTTIWDYQKRFSFTTTNALSSNRHGPPLIPGGRASVGCGPSQGWGSATYTVPAQFSMGAVINYNSSTDTPFFGCWVNAGQMLYTNGSACRFYVNVNFASQAAAPALGSHFWIGTYDGTTATLYIDGVSVATSVTGAPTAGQTWAFNNYSGAYRANGNFKISDAFVLSRSLGATEVEALARLFLDT